MDLVKYGYCYLESLSSKLSSTEIGLLQQNNGRKHRSKSTTENTPSGVAQSVLTSSRLRCCVMTSKEQFTPDIPRTLWNWNNFVKRNYPKFFLTVVQVWSAITENVWLRLLLPKEGQPVIKSKGSHTFSNLHCEWIHGVINKEMKNSNCLSVISLSRLCSSFV